jgi:hypothetical protein
MPARYGWRQIASGLLGLADQRREAGAAVESRPTQPVDRAVAVDQRRGLAITAVIVITDLTSGTGRFNLARGTIGAMTGIAASLSTAATGFFFQEFGAVSGFILIAVIAGAATVLLWVFLSETKPTPYLD